MVNKKVLIEVELDFEEDKEGNLIFNFDDNVDILNDIGHDFEINQIIYPKNIKEE